MSEHKIIHNSNNLIVSFGGMWDTDSAIKFEFYNYLSKIYKNKSDLYFFIDKHRSWYHKGIDGITNNINETVVYLNNIIIEGNYKKIIFIGIYNCFIYIIWFIV